MSNITAEMVKELRERTGVGMMECKKALVAANGDMQKAIEDMRISGQAKADKKAGRTAAQGVIRIVSKSGRALMMEVNCETDFVARDAHFKEFVESAAQTAMDSGMSDVIQLGEQFLSGTRTTVEQARQASVAKLGENIQLRRAHFKASEVNLGVYNHGGQIGVVVELSGGSEDLAKDIAMHIAASKPLYLTPDQVPQEVLTAEREIFIAQSKDSGKPAEIVEKMTQGRLQKFVDEITLVGQPFVKDPAIKVGALLKQHGAKVLDFVRFQVGEGIEKTQVDFAAEVMAQVKGV